MKIGNRFFIIITFIFLSIKCFAYSDSEFPHTSFLISNYSSVSDNLNNTLELLESNVDGFIVDIVKEDSVFYILNLNSKVSLDSFVSDLHKYLNKCRDEIVVLIVRNRFNLQSIEDYFRKTDLQPYLYPKNTFERWCSIKQLYSINKRLILFSEQLDEPDLEYFIDLNKKSFCTSEFNVVNHDVKFNGNIISDIHQVDLGIFSSKTLPVAEQFRNVMNLWKRSGKKPTFLIDNKADRDSREIVDLLNKQYFVKGEVKDSLKLLSEVNWQNSSMISHGRFTYPIKLEQELEFIPEKSGYSFTPTVSLASIRKDPIVNFEAKEFFDLEESLTSSYGFDSKIQCDVNNRNNAFNFGTSIVDDDIRGKVAMFSSRDYATIPNIDRYNIFGSYNFSISMWFRVRNFAQNSSNIVSIQRNDGVDFSAFLENRILKLRFFGDSVTTKFRSDYEWHHLVVSYSYSQGELETYIDGELIGISNVKKRQVLKNNIILGKYMDLSLEGYIDDFKSWNKKLCKDEVHMLFSKEERRASLSDRIVAYYTLSGDSENCIDHNRLKGTDYNIEYVDDDKFGLVAEFNGANSYIDCGNSSDFNITNILSVSAWIRPTKLKDHVSIIGKGFSYSAKMFDNFMLFTTTFISDHFSAKSILKENEWQHVCYVFNAGDNVSFYLNGKFISSTNASVIKPYENSFLIGSNLWGQYFKGRMHQIAIWNRALSESEIKRVYDDTKEGDDFIRGDFKTKLYIIVFSILLFALLLSLMFKILSKSRDNILWKNGVVDHADNGSEIISYTNRLYLFGPFTIYNNKGVDVTSKFTPRLKQLFLVVVLHSLSNKSGISTKKLSDIMWPGVSPQSAKNNRSTNIQNLRSILIDIDGVEIVFEDKMWRAIITNQFYCDYKDFISDVTTINKNTSSNTLSILLNILERGELLPNQSFEWLDKYKNQTSNEVIDILTSLISDSDIKSSKKILCKIAKVLLQFDPVNELSLTILVNHYKENGKQLIAKRVFDHFLKEYKILYDEEYSNSFKDI